MPEVNGYEQDYIIETKYGDAVLEQAICFAGLNRPGDVLGWVDWDGKEPELEDMEFIRQPYHPHEKRLTPEMVDRWLDYMEYRFGAAIEMVDRKEKYVRFKIKRICQQETFIAMTAVRSIGEQPDAVNFFYRATNLGFDKDYAFIMSYMMVATRHGGDIFKFGSLNGRTIHIPIDPRGWTKHDVDDFKLYPKPHRVKCKGQNYYKSYYQHHRYDKLHSFTSENDVGYGDHHWGSGFGGTNIDFSNPEESLKTLTTLEGALNGRVKKETSTGSRTFRIR